MPGALSGLMTRLNRLRGKRIGRFIGGKLGIDTTGFGTEWDAVAITISPSPDLNGQLWHLVRGDELTNNFVVLEKPSVIIPVQDDAIFDINGVPVVFLYVSGAGAIRPVTGRDAVLSLLSNGVVVRCVDGDVGVLGASETVDYVVSKIMSNGSGDDNGKDSVECTVGGDALTAIDSVGAGAAIVPIDNQRVVVVPIRKSVLNDLVFRSALDRHITASASNYPALLQTAVELARAKTQQFMAHTMRNVIIIIIVFMLIIGFFLLAPQLIHGFSAFASLLRLPRPPP